MFDNVTEVTVNTSYGTQMKRIELYFQIANICQQRI